MSDGKPWLADRETSTETAVRRIERQFPELRPTSATLFSEGWDNRAFLVNDRFVFRFPRREVAVELLRAETRLLPSLVDRLPIAISAATFVGQPDEDDDWPFAGYERIPGTTACRADLDEDTRRRMAALIGRFLRALHAVPEADAVGAGAPHDTWRRLDLPYRREQVEERLAQCRENGLLDRTDEWSRLADDIPADWTPARTTLVHGDLYARHLLVDETGDPCGVIDWGDVHVGDRAIDLSVARGFLPPSAAEAFLDAYGPVDPDTWRVARFKALFSAIMILLYGADIDDRELVREARTSLEHLRG